MRFPTFCRLLTILAVLALGPAAAPVGGAARASEQVRISVCEIEGRLTVDRPADTPIYTAYFHVPVPTENQVPLQIDVRSEQLVSLRWMRTTNGNILGVARLRSAEATNLDWTAYVLIDEVYYEDLPEYPRIDALTDLPDSLARYLMPTATVQVDCEPVQQWAEPRRNLLHVDFVADLVCDYVHDIPFSFESFPAAFDAYYALNWGNSCTGHGHAATALLRALGIPSRTKLVLLSWFPTVMDMHWTTDFWMPDYGWVCMDPSNGMVPFPAYREIVFYACAPSDEFPLFHIRGVEGFWHTSNRELGENPDWNNAHQVIEGDNYTYTTTDDRDRLFAAARRALDAQIATLGRTLDLPDAGRLAGALDLQELAREHLQANDVIAGTEALAAAITRYEAIEPVVPVVRWRDDCEGGPLGWSHGGMRDEWELGVPGGVGPAGAHSGETCWGLDLDGDYELGAECWLESPPIDLSGLVQAQFVSHLWIQTWGSEETPGEMDELWLEISSGGGPWQPFCGRLFGGSDNPLIPVVPGWARLDLDLTPYAGSTVQVRFRFRSGGEMTRAGVYVDDLAVKGLLAGPSDVADPGMPASGGALTRLIVAPNPFNPRTRISFELAEPASVRVELYDLLGRRVTTLADREFKAGPHALDWDGTDRSGRAVAAGGYLVRVEADGRSWSRKALLVR